MFPSQCVYWENADSLRCSCWVSAASRAGVALRPRMATAAFPGRAWVAANTTTETRNSVRSPSRTRLRMNLAMCRPPVRSWSRSGLESHVLEPVLTQREPGLRLHKAGQLGAVGIDLVGEVRDDVSALVVLQRLSLHQDL